jgi:hypothetical protein
MSYPELSDADQRVSGAATETFVLVKDRAADDWRTGAVGVLIDTDIVMVPAPPRGLLDQGEQVDVILCGPPNGHGPEPECVGGRRAVVLRLTGGRAVVGYVQLDRGSRHPSLNVTRPDKERLVDALADCGGDYWSAMDGVGIVRDPRPRFEAGTLWSPSDLDGVAHGFAGGPLDTKEREYQTLGELGTDACCPTKCCKRSLFPR